MDSQRPKNENNSGGPRLSGSFPALGVSFHRSTIGPVDVFGLFACNFCEAGVGSVDVTGCGRFVVRRRGAFSSPCAPATLLWACVYGTVLPVVVSPWREKKITMNDDFCDSESRLEFSVNCSRILLECVTKVERLEIYFMCVHVRSGASCLHLRYYCSISHIQYIPH